MNCPNTTCFCTGDCTKEERRSMFPVDQEKCSHSFAWYSVVPPSQCPLCGATLNNVQWPRVRYTNSTASAH